MKTLAFLYIILFSSLCFFCSKKLFQIKEPIHFPVSVYNFTNNPISEEKILLGRVLFYDPILSEDNTISCASCHSPYNAFAHTDHNVSHGIRDRTGTRNAPALFNLAWQKSFMWDGAINHLDMQALFPITHPLEMNETLENVVSKIQNKPLYATLFRNAYQDSTITSERIFKALSQFQLSLISSNSKYDKVKSGIDKFTEQEEKGYVLFQKNCNSCHAEPLFSTYQFANNGLPINQKFNDLGKFKQTQQPKDSLLFKIPSLRNLSYTYPYMHDGRFKKLNEVLNHYISGMQESKTLAPELNKGISLTADEKVELIAFLLTLDDKEFIFNPKNQFPKEILMSSEGKEK